jgi:hypothetical protein
MSLNILESQRNSIHNFFSLDTYEKSTFKTVVSKNLWKILLYDKKCQNILAPLFKVQQIVCEMIFIILLTYAINTLSRSVV